MAEVMACPAWCSEHVDPDPSEPGDEGAHFGQQLTVVVTEPPGLSDDQSFVVQLAAHDYRGQRETMIYLDNPGRGVAQITEWQAKAIVVNLLHATEQPRGDLGFAQELRTQFLTFGISFGENFERVLAWQPWMLHLEHRAHRRCRGGVRRGIRRTAPLRRPPRGLPSHVRPCAAVMPRHPR